MAHTKLTLVVSLNRETNKFQPHDHNLTTEAAANMITSLRNEGVDATAIVQELKHRPKYAQTCASCKAAAEHATSEHSQGSGETSEQGDEEFAEVGDGGDSQDD